MPLLVLAISGHAGSDCQVPVLRAALAPALSHGRAQTDPATGVKKFQRFIAAQGNLLEKEEALELLERRGKSGSGPPILFGDLAKGEGTALGEVWVSGGFSYTSQGRAQFGNHLRV